MTRSRSLKNLASASLAALCLGAVQAEAASPFNGLTGTWSGSGSFRLEDGRSEAIRCNANYVPRGTGLGLALRCASASNKVELRANLVSTGSKVSGSWEERSFNASGQVTGLAVGDTLRLSINGGGLSGSMLVRTTGGSQSISVRTDTSALKGVNNSLRRR
jgi:hypothetical protein